jgi:hypothetical protein
MSIAGRYITMRGGNIIGTPPVIIPPSLLLDLYPATAAFSVRKLRTAYTGACMRVRRSSDNAEQDIGFVGNNLDTGALLSFVGSTNGFVTTWYDQQFNLNLTQTNASSQPRIVNSGAIDLVNLLPAVYGNGNSFMFIPSSTGLFNFLHNGTLSFISSVQKSDSTTSIRRLYGNLAGASGNVGYLNFQNNLTINSFTSRGVVGSLTVNNFSTNILTSNQYLLSSEIDAGNSTASLRNKIYFNGGGAIANNTLLNTPSLANATANFSLFDDGTTANRFTGHFQELIIYNTNQSANRAAIETNINAYYGIY